MAQQPAREALSFRVVVVRSGGVAGISQTWQVEPADSDDDLDAWRALVDACPWGAVGSDPAARDRFIWQIEARMPHPVRVASVPDSLLNGPWRALVDRVQQQADRA